VSTLAGLSIMGHHLMLPMQQAVISNMIVNKLLFQCNYCTEHHKLPFVSDKTLCLLL